MKLIKQALFKVELLRPHTSWNDCFYVEAENFEEAINLSREVLKDSYEGWEIKSITIYSSVFKSSTKTITINV